ncbi:MAG: protein-tyrosine kinase [Lachnospiraceae bacterium]|nr:protein-tyrosine kinase [Lachnospiraceae bacterium]
MGNREEEIEIDLAEVLSFLLHWLWLIFLSAFLCGTLGLLISVFVVSPKYESTTKVYILNKQNINGNISYSDTQLATQLTKDYEELITCRNVLERVISELKLDDSYETLQSRITVANASDTRIISITVKDENPEEARRIANEVRDVASAHITDVMDIEAVNVVDEANLPDIDKPAEPSVMKYTAIGGFIGAFICIVFLMVKYLADDTIRVSEDVEKYLELSTLGLIPVMEEEVENNKKKKNRNKRKGSGRKNTESADAEKDNGYDIGKLNVSDSKVKNKNIFGNKYSAQSINSAIQVADIDSLDEEVSVQDTEEGKIIEQMEQAESETAI